MGEGEGEGEGEMPNLLEIWLECASVDDALVALEVVLQRRVLDGLFRHGDTAEANHLAVFDIRWFERAGTLWRAGRCVDVESLWRKSFGRNG